MGQPLVYGLRQPSKPEIFILHKFRKTLVEKKKHISTFLNSLFKFSNCLNSFSIFSVHVIETHFM